MEFFKLFLILLILLIVAVSIMIIYVVIIGKFEEQKKSLIFIKNSLNSIISTFNKVNETVKSKEINKENKN
jgi:hypothetical protein